jgi:SAM-dependent methyltransferase
MATIAAVNEAAATGLPRPPPGRAMRALTPQEARALRGTGAWVDVRDEAAFAAGHLPGSGNLPLAAWTERRHEWPPPETAVVVVADEPGDAREAAARLAAAGYTSVRWLEAPWSALGAAPVRGSPARLWDPARFLEQAVAGLPRGVALDVACGTGRDAVYLALEGFDVEAWDHDDAALDRARDLARRHGVTIRTVTADLESVEPPAFAESRFAVVACFRYLHRPLFPALARALAPGGYLIYETFREGQERFGRPRRPRFLLRPGELREAFPGLEVLRYEEPSPAGGPITSRLLARRPGS